MHRNKFGTEYDTLPGGGVEAGETLEHAVIREVEEETTIAISDLRLVIVEQAGDPYGTQYIYLANYVSGEPALSPDSEETKINKLGQNLYDPRWVPLSELPTSPFVSEKLKNALLMALETGFPETPLEIR